MVSIVTKSITILLCFFLLLIHEVSAGDNKIETITQAATYLSKFISAIPAENTSLIAYQKKHTNAVLACAKILYDNAFNQILNALSEIDSRIVYWQYQKDHPWNYFISKNPLKWVSGPGQDVEVINNLEALKSHQGELYVLLGQFSELGTVFTQEYKSTFLADYNKAYEWINKLLDVVNRIKINKEINEDVPFIAQMKKLKLMLENVTNFKNDLLSDISDTAIPSYVERNWFKGGLSLFTAAYSYKNYYDHIANTLGYTRQKGLEYVVTPVKDTLKDLITPGWQSPEQQKKISKLDESQQVNKQLAQAYLNEMGEQYKLQSEAQEALKKLEENDYSLYNKFVEKVGEKDFPEVSLLGLMVSTISLSNVVEEIRGWINRMKNYGRGLSVGAKAEGTQYTQDIVDYAKGQQKQYEAVGKLVLLIPAALATGALYTGYQKLTEKNYAPLRRALVDINSLFINPSKPLTDEQYGKMIYLVHMLKKRAEKELPIKKNVREDFIQDLEKIESSEFNVAAKRAIIEDMFKKYHFLGLVQKK